MQKCKKMADDIANIISLDPHVHEALCKSEREAFVPVGFSSHAYKLDALPISGNQWISSPLTVAKMTQALQTQGADSVLEIGCGSGYQALVLSKLIRRVFTIERIDRLLSEAKQRFGKLGVYNIHTRFDDGQNGWPSYAPYDRILLSASISDIPQELFEQLAPKGILVAPIEKEGKQIITRYHKDANGNIEKEVLDTCLFVPILAGKAP